MSIRRPPPLTPTTVTWLSFITLALIASISGLVGSRYVFVSVEDEFLLHGVEHNRRLATQLADTLLEGLRRRLAATDIEGHFRTQLQMMVNPEGYRVSLIDRDRHRVIAGSRNLGPTERRLALDLVSSATGMAQGGPDAADPWHGVVRAVSADGRPLIAYLTPIRHRGPSGEIDWALLIESDVTSIMTSIGRLHRRVDLILLLTALSVTALGFGALRRIGRVYEQSLEKTVHARTRELRLAQVEMLRKARLATIGQTASMLTHEMRNPLASLKLALSTVLSGRELGNRNARRMRIALREVDRLDALLSETLDYVRPIALDPRPIGLDALLDRTLEVLQPSFEAGRHRLRRGRCESCPPIRLDQKKMQQALLNLLKNALEASEPEGTISLDLVRDQSGVSLVIRNVGAPIRPQDLERVFEPFFTTRSSGTGLGLPLAKRVIEEHGGRLSLASSLETGTEARVTLPLTTPSMLST